MESIDITFEVNACGRYDIDFKQVSISGLGDGSKCVNYILSQLPKEIKDSYKYFYFYRFLLSLPTKNSFIVEKKVTNVSSKKFPVLIRIELVFNKDIMFCINKLYLAFLKFYNENKNIIETIIPVDLNMNKRGVDWLVNEIDTALGFYIQKLFPELHYQNYVTHNTDIVNFNDDHMGVCKDAKYYSIVKLSDYLMETLDVDLISLIKYKDDIEITNDLLKGYSFVDIYNSSVSYLFGYYKNQISKLMEYLHNKFDLLDSIKSVFEDINRIIIEGLTDASSDSCLVYVDTGKVYTDHSDILEDWCDSLGEEDYYTDVIKYGSEEKYTGYAFLLDCLSRLKYKDTYFNDMAEVVAYLQDNNVFTDNFVLSSMFDCNNLEELKTTYFDKINYDYVERLTREHPELTWGMYYEDDNEY